jgi:ribokinase
MKAHPAIVVVGSYMRDLVMNVDMFPKPGETRFGHGHFAADGGKGSNQAVQAARCGATVAMVAAVGDDDNGRGALAMWSREGVDAAHVMMRSNFATGVAMILVESGGQNEIAIDAGANLSITPDDVEQAAEAIANATLVIAQLEVPALAVRTAFELARAAGTATLLNAAPAPRRPIGELMSLTDILIVNEVEAAALAGIEAEIDAETGQAIADTLGLETLIITAGANGAYLLRRGAAALHEAPPHIDRVVDTTGAGDAFIGAFAARFVETGDAAAALGYGLAAGTLACTVAGALPSFRTLEDISPIVGRPASLAKPALPS